MNDIHLTYICGYDQTDANAPVDWCGTTSSSTSFREVSVITSAFLLVSVETIESRALLIVTASYRYTYIYRHQVRLITYHTTSHCHIHLGQQCAVCISACMYVCMCLCMELNVTAIAASFNCDKSSTAGLPVASSISMACKVPS